MTRRVKNEKGDSYTLFFTMVSPFSNFHPCTFYEEDDFGEKKRFSCVEQFYMFMKAALFDDRDTADEVMRERNPKKMKSLGKNVKGFNQQKWDNLSPQVMHKALTAKFSQNKGLRRYLFLSQGSMMVEASPMDTVWGIGLPMDSPDAVNPNRWRGTNRLGKIMTAVREDLLQKEEFQAEAEETLREIALNGSDVFMDLQSDPAGSSYRTPQQTFKRNHESDPRDAKRQRMMDDYVSTPNSSSYGGNSRFGEREVRTEPRMMPSREEEDRLAARRERFGSRDVDMRNRGREEGAWPGAEETRMRERIAMRMDQQGNRQFGQPPRPMITPPDYGQQRGPRVLLPDGPRMGPPEGMMNMPPPGYLPHPARGANGGYSGPPPPLPLPPSLPPLPPGPSGPPGPSLPSLPPLPPGPPPMDSFHGLPPLPPMAVPPPPMVEESTVPPPPPPTASVVIEVQAGVVHSGGKKTEEKEEEEGKETSVSASKSSTKIRMNLQKERVQIVNLAKTVEASPSILSLRKKIKEGEELMQREKDEEKEKKEKKVEDEEVKNEEGELEEGEVGPPKAYSIKRTVQSEKRRLSTRTRMESSSEEEKTEKKEEKKKDDAPSRDRKENGDRRDERRSDIRSSMTDRRDDSRDRGRRRSASRDGRDKRRDRSDVRRDSRDNYRSRDRKDEERRRDDSRRRDDRNEVKTERRKEDDHKERRRSSGERKEKDAVSTALTGEKSKEEEKSEKKAKKAERKEAKAARRAEKEEKKRKKTDQVEGNRREKETEEEKEEKEDTVADKELSGKKADKKDKDTVVKKEDRIEKKEKDTVDKKDNDTVDKKDKDTKKEEKGSNGVNGKEEVNTSSSKRLPVEAPSSTESKKHPRIEAPPAPAAPVPRRSFEQNLFQKLQNMKKKK